MSKLEFTKLNEFSSKNHRLNLEFYLNELDIPNFLHSVALELSSYNVIFFDEHHYSVHVKRMNNSYKTFISTFLQEFTNIRHSFILS